MRLGSSRPRRTCWLALASACPLAIVAASEPPARALDAAAAFRSSQQTRGLATIRTAEGQTVELYEQSHALVIGMSTYQSGWRPLPGVDSDVVAVRDALQAHGFTVRVERDLTREAFDRTLREFIAAQGMSARNRIIIYFAGHGHTQTASDGRQFGFVVPIDAPLPTADPVGFRSRAVSMDQIEVYAREIESRHVLMVFDSCFSGTLFDVTRALPGAIASNLEQPVRQFITAGSAGQEVPDTSEFRRQFVAALQGEADLTNDGYISGTELGLFLEDRVASYTRQAQTPRFGKIRDGRLDKGDIIFLSPRTPAGGKPAAPATAPVPRPISPIASASLEKPAEALANLERIAKSMPRGELGQTAAFHSLVQHGYSLAGTDLLEGLAFKGSFDRAELAEARLHAVQVEGGLRGANLSGASLALASLDKADLSGARAEAAAFAFAMAQSTSFADLQAPRSTWFATQARTANFKGADLSGAGFMFADLRDAIFDGANLTGAVFVASDLRGASFAGATLDNTDFTGSRLTANALTRDQAAQACQMAVSLPPGAYAHVTTITVTEPVPNASVAGGYQYRDFFRIQQPFTTPSNGLSSCSSRSIPDDRWFPVSQLGGRESLQRDLRFSLSHRLLQQSGRRAEVRTRIAGALDDVYPFPSGVFTATVAAADLPAAHQPLSGTWTLEFTADGQLIIRRGKESPAAGRIAKKPDLKFDLTGGSGPLMCGQPGEYGWFFTLEGPLQLHRSGDGCPARAVLLARQWTPAPPGR